MTPAQQEALDAMARHGTQADAARALNISTSALQDRLNRGRANLETDPAIRASMVAVGTDLVPDMIWAKTSSVDGTSYSVRLKPQQADQEDIGDVIRRALLDAPRLPLIPAPTRVEADLMDVIPIADIHWGGDYGRPEYEAECLDTMDRLFAAMAPAQKATIIDLGDTTDANDHLGVTPGGKNPVDVKRHGLLHVVGTAIRFLKHVTYRALETHQEVELHVLRGNHSETSYIGVLLALREHFENNPRVTVVVPPEDGPESMFRMIHWGQCGALVDHGDRMKWRDLKDVWTATFADSWAACKAYRGIYTAHFHSDKAQDLAGVEARHFRSMSAPSLWAQARFPPMPRSASALTWHKTEGLAGVIQKKLRPIPYAGAA